MTVVDIVGSPGWDVEDAAGQIDGVRNPSSWTDKPGWFVLNHVFYDNSTGQTIKYKVTKGEKFEPEVVQFSFTTNKVKHT